MSYNWHKSRSDLHREYLEIMKHAAARDQYGKRQPEYRPAATSRPETSPGRHAAESYAPRATEPRPEATRYGRPEARKEALSAIEHRLRHESRAKPPEARTEQADHARPLPQPDRTGKILTEKFLHDLGREYVELLKQSRRLEARKRIREERYEREWGGSFTP